jgi:ArsR family transcriptional regulator
MAFAANNSFSDQEVHLAEIFKALSHPGRLAILRVLAKKKTCICCDLVADLSLAQSTVSQHLKALKAANLVKGQIDGPRYCYCLNFEALAEVQKLSEGFFDLLQGPEVALDCCESIGDKIRLNI